NEVIGRNVTLLDMWTDRWQNGETLAELRPAIIESGTDGQGNYDSELKIAEIYQDVLGREAEATEIYYWRNQLENGATLSQVRQQLDGAEFIINTNSPVYTNPENGHRYFLTIPDTWLGAQEQAQALGGNLVTISNAEENQWLVDTFGRRAMWIGLNDSPIYGNTEGNDTWNWVSEDPVTFLNWAPNQPDNVLHTPEGENFTEINFMNPGNWNDMPSQQTWIRPGIVEIPNTEYISPLNNPPVVTTTNVALTGATENAGFILTHADLVAATGATDVDGDPLMFRIETVGSDIPTKNGQPVETGVTTLSAGESIVWTPSTIGNGQLAFTATVTDGKATAETPIQVSIDVNPIIVTVEATKPDASENGDLGEFTFTRTGDTSEAMTVNFAIASATHWSRPQATNGIDYEEIPTWITIPAGESSATLTIVPIDDDIVEWPETVRLQVIDGEGYTVSSSQNLDTVTIWDNETPRVQVYTEWYGGYSENFNRHNYVSESGNNGTFLFRRQGDLSQPLTVNYSLTGTAQNGVDYILPESITIAAGETDYSLRISAINDDQVQGERTLILTVTPSEEYDILEDWGTRLTTIWDNDDKPTLEIRATNPTVSKYGDPGEFTITRSGWDTSEPLTVDYWISTAWWHKAENGVDYQEIPETIVIPAGESSVTIDINPIPGHPIPDDKLVDIFLLANPGYAISRLERAIVTIEENQTQELDWKQQFGTASDDIAHSIAVGSTGNIYSVGQTFGDLGGPNAGGSDAFITKKNSSGNLLWQIQFGTADDDQAKQIVMDGADNLYILGWTENPSNSWIAKYDKDGNSQWQQFLGEGYDITNGVLTRSQDGSLYVAGRTTDNLEGINQGATDAWVAKYDSNGNQTWVKQFGTDDEDEVFGITVDNEGNIYLTGETKGAFAGPRDGDGDAWVAQLNSNGEFQWQTQLGTAARDVSYSVAVDNQGHVYLGGQTFGWLGETYPGNANDWIGDRDAWWKGIHGDRSGLGGTYYGNGDAWVAQLDSATGTINWKRLIGTPEADTATKVVADSLGNVYLTGTTQGKIGDAQYGGDDIFLAKYNLNGALQWKKQFGSDGDDIVNDLILDITGLYLTGKTTGNLKGSNLGENDAWVMTFS
ncbi:MAG: SBBP repeat-containing protein, partial [Chroococcales cyanobacterium]